MDRCAQDLHQLREGKVRFAKKRLSCSKEVREEAFERYLRIFYREQPHVEVRPLCLASLWHPRGIRSKIPPDTKFCR